MANVELKKDFKDGQFLYGDDLNNNFKVIEAGINANEKNLQNVIDQAQEDLKDELEEITGERGWDWNDNSGERVTFYKGDTNQVNEKPISNGQLLYDITTGETALDTGGKRVTTGAGNVLAVSDEEPTNPGTKVWINPDKIVKQAASNVVDSLDGNERDKSPSVKAVKTSLNQMQSNIESAINGTVLYDNADGTQEGTTLNESANNFKYIEIFFKNIENVYNSVKVYQPNNKIVSCSSPLASNNNRTKTYLRSTDYTISETSITPRRKLYMEMTETGITSFITDTNNILITRVVGYK